MPMQFCRVLDNTDNIIQLLDDNDAGTKITTYLDGVIPVTLIEWFNQDLSEVVDADVLSFTTNEEAIANHCLLSWDLHGPACLPLFIPETAASRPELN